MSALTAATLAYSRFLAEQPILSQVLTMSAFCGLGDLLAQTLRAVKNPRSPYDWKRVAKFTAKGIGCGVIWSHWFLLAELWSDFVTTWIMRHYLLTQHVKLFAIVRTIINLLLEQFVACPVIFGLWDLPIISVMDGVSLKLIPGVVRQKLFKLLIAHAKLWTIVNVMVYNIPLNLRVLLVSVADLFWESIVSTVASKPDETNDEEQPDTTNSKVRVS